MSDCSEGPVSTLPGNQSRPPIGQMCDTEGHENIPAIKRIQGETDSFYAEYFDVCQECLDKYLEEVKALKDELRRCDYCKKEKKDVRPFRDYDEGTAGPVYDVCGDCRRAINASFADDGGDDPH